MLAVAADGARLERSIRRRELGEPLAWIVGSAPFAGRRVHVAPGVYVPRPSTEALARRAAAALPRAGRAIDLCTGSGAVGAHLVAEVPGAAVVGADLDPLAVRTARRNGVAAVVADLDVAFRDDVADVVTVVAPYVPTAALDLLPADVRDHEPRRALDGGVDGLDVVRRAVTGASRVLRRGGALLVELGAGQHESLAPALVAVGFGSIDVWRDDEGDVRGLGARLAR